MNIMNSQRTLVTGLTFSAILLSALLMVRFGSLDRPALAASTSRAGDYVVATAALDGETDLLWVADAANRQLVVYGSDSAGRVTALAGANLQTVFNPPQSAETSSSDGAEGASEIER